MGVKMNKQAQVTIFVIVAIIIVALLILFFLFRDKLILPGSKSSMPNIQQDMDSCVKSSIQNAVDIMLPQGGYLQPENYKLYNDVKIAYLCYNRNYYASCISQEPLYLNHLKDELKSYISSKIDDCFYQLKKDYENKGYGVSYGSSNYEIILNPKQIELVISKKIEISKNEDNKVFNKLNYRIANSLYDLGSIANDISNQEAKYCYFEYLGYQLTNSGFSIEKTDINGETKIYSIRDKVTNNQLNIAIRSCAMPAGM